MPYSNIVKKVYAQALRDLMEDIPFEKITVTQICEKCDMNRKSFYYHFKDKYDLVTWIFDEDYVALVKDHSYSTWEFLDVLCEYLYNNKDFYRKLLNTQGQNSFSQHFEEFLSPMVKNRLQQVFGSDNVPKICIDFITDGFVCSVKRWLSDKECIPASEYVSVMKSLIEKIATIYSE